MSIEIHTRALDLTPKDHPDLRDRLAHLAAPYYDRFQHLGELDDVEKAIEYDTRALELTPEVHPDFPDRLTGLGLSYYDRFQRLGELDDIKRAIEYHTRALNLTPNDHPDLSYRFASLGSSYYSRFERLGELDDIDKSIECETRALDLIPKDHPDFSERLAGLAWSYSYRYQRLGELDDIEKSIAYNVQALGLTPKGHPHLPSRLAGLGSCYYGRFQRRGELDNIEKAIQYQIQALDLTPRDHPHLPSQLADLGATHLDRFQRLGEPDDIRKSIEYKTSAFNLTPNNHPDLPSRLSQLGAAHHHRFQRLGELDDIEKAIEYETRAINITPDNHPDSPLKYHSLAYAQFKKFQHTDNLHVLHNSLGSFRKASQTLIGAPRSKFRNALQWATIASQHHALCPIEAYQTTMDLLLQFIWLGATTQQRYEDLLEVGALAVDAASTAILSSKYELALEWLEHARCVVWNQSLVLRSPLDTLRASYPNIGARLHEVAVQLHSTSSEPRTSQVSPGALAVERVGQQHHRLAKEYNDLIAQVRRLPGYEDFLQPIKASELVKAARNGPVVVINFRVTCHALIIVPGEDRVRSIELPSFSLKQVKSTRSYMQKLLNRSGFRQRGAHLDCSLEEDSYEDLLKLLWDTIVKPILDFLGYMTKLPAGNLPHIVWCPTGTMSFLPLHAAGDYDQPDSRVFDYVISSYTPTLTALLSSSPGSLRPGSRVLGISQEVTSTPGYRLNKLPGTTKELNLMKQHVGHMDDVEFSELKGGKATKSAVLDAMERHDWVHIACHAHQNVGDATESGFFLHDGILDLASINRRSLKNKGLAFLSACQTATGDEKLPDEAVHLASGMLMAGYSSVIATMWSVVDDDAPFVADKVYAQLMKDGKVGNGEAAKALHYATKALREKVGVKEFARWVPYVHIGS
ncbi:unnamed protein product [Rhizoctonia solani]|uniref:CHAT domain-containing protein n=1 Tax=Rhizoctonia solani TaxID=456999 RepID=A0A8H2XUB8_9AGAM|nr:unnamed protein product [Rhizoctonia solani]